MIGPVIAPVAALLILVLTMSLAVDLLVDWSAGDPVKGRHVTGVMMLVLLLTWRIATRVLTGTM